MKNSLTEFLEEFINQKALGGAFENGMHLGKAAATKTSAAVKNGGMQARNLVQRETSTEAGKYYSLRDDYSQKGV